jgi:uncharacterized RDD family membrane protein YckC
MGFDYEYYSALIDVVDGCFKVSGFLCIWPPSTLTESSDCQATFGKQLLGIKVTGMRGEPIGFGKASKRFRLKGISVPSLGSGLLLVAFTERKQGIHDRFAATLVVRSRCSFRRVGSKVELDIAD